MKQWRWVAAVFCILALNSIPQTGTVSRQEFEMDLVLSWGQLYNDYLNFRERLGPLVPPNSVPYDEAGSKMAVSDWSFLNQNWLFKFDGGTRYVSSLSTLGITAPTTIQIYEDIRLGDVIILSTGAESKQFKGEALFTAPAFMQYEADFPRNKYLFDELSPRRVLWEITLKPQSYIQSDLLEQEAAAQAEQLRMAMMPKSSPPLRTGIWVELDFDTSNPTVNIHASDGITNRVELYSREHLDKGGWNYFPHLTANLASNNPASFLIEPSMHSQFYIARSADVDSDGDGIPDAREQVVFGTDAFNGNDVTRKAQQWEPLSPVHAVRLARSGSTLFVSGNQTLSQFDLSDPLSPVRIASTDISMTGTVEIAATRRYVYGFQSRTNGLLAFNRRYSEIVSVAAVSAGSVTNPTFCALTVQDGFLYLADDNGIEIYSLAVPSLPQWISSVPAVSNLMVRGMYVDGDVLYAGYRGTSAMSGIGGYAVWDISNPAEPVLDTYVSTGTMPYEFIRNSNTLFIAESYISLSTGLARKTKLSSFNLSGESLTNYAPLASVEYGANFFSPKKMTIHNDWMYALENSVLSVFDISNPLDMQAVLKPYYGGTLDDMERYNSVLYIAAGDGGLTVWNTSNPVEPALSMAIGVHEDVVDIVGDGECVYLGRTLGVMSLNGSADPAKQMRFASGKATGFCMDGEQNTYVTFGYDGFGVYYADGQYVAMDYITDSLTSVAALNGFAYCTARRGNALLTIDCTVPGTLIRSYTNNALGYIDRVKVDENKIYATSFDKGLLLFDLSNPAEPELTGTFNTRSCFRDVAVGSNVVYGADGVNGLLIIDISNPALPQKIAELELEYARRVAVSGNSACVIGYRSVYFIDIRNPAQPVLWQEFVLENAPVAVCATERFFHVVDVNSVVHSYFIP